MATLGSDNFDRANSTGLGASWFNNSYSGGIGGFDIASNKAVPHTLSSNDSFNMYDITWPNDQWSQATVTVTGTTGSDAGVCVQVRAAREFTATTTYRAGLDHAASNNYFLHKFVSGTFTSISQTTTAFADGDVLYVEIQGTSLVGKLNGTTKLSTTDSATASGNAGISFSTAETAATLNDWSGGDFTSSGLPPGLGPAGEMEMATQSAISAMMR